MSLTPLGWAPPPIDQHLCHSSVSLSQRHSLLASLGALPSRATVVVVMLPPFTDTPPSTNLISLSLEHCCNKYLSSRSENPSRAATSEWCDRRYGARHTLLSFRFPVAFLGIRGSVLGAPVSTSGFATHTFGTVSILRSSRRGIIPLDFLLDFRRAIISLSVNIFFRERALVASFGKISTLKFGLSSDFNQNHFAEPFLSSFRFH